MEPQARARRRPRSAVPILIALMALAAAGAGWYWMTRPEMPKVVEAPASAQTAAQSAPETAPAAPPELQPPAADQVVKAEDITAALTQLLGRDAVLKFLEATNFPRRFVATLDNLGREHAPVAVWPVQPAPGRFVVQAGGESQVMAAENALRYGPFVAFAGSVNAAQAVDLYRRMYPVLEQTYRELGFANRTLHARVFEVIDLLLATPEPAQPPKLTLTEVKGPIASARPWTRYEYADAGLQRLSSGQKILLRVGPDNRKVLKAKLQELRQELLRVSIEPARP
jgi:hypothetical protein